MSRYRIYTELLNNEGSVYVIQFKCFFMWFTMKGKYSSLDDAVAAYDKLEQS